MKPVEPVYEDNRELPEYAATATLGEHQPEYQPLPVIALVTGDVLSRWKLTPAEIEQVVRTGEIYLVVSTFNKGFPPVQLTCLPPDISTGCGGGVPGFECKEIVEWSDLKDSGEEKTDNG